MTLVMIIFALVGVFVFYKMIHKSLETQNKTGLVITGIIMVLAAIVVVAVANDAGHKRVDKQEYVPQSNNKAEQPELTAQDEEISARRRSNTKQNAPARSRQMEAERQRQLAEERVANRLTKEEFNGRLDDKVNSLVQASGLTGTSTLGEPTYTVNGNKEIFRYTLSVNGNVVMNEFITNNYVKGVNIIVYKVNREDVVSAIILYDFMLQILTPNIDGYAIFHALNLDETALENLDKSQSVTLKGYKFEKNFSSKTLTLSVAEE